jgi:hypothetical protein
MEFCADQLGIDKDISLRVRRDPQWSVRNKTFGRYNDGTNELEVGIGGRHIMDVLRTVAHELVHQKQNQDNTVPADAGEDGSEYENEANAQAGVLMRQYGKLHPELFATGVEVGEKKIVDESMASLVSQDQAERNEYQQFVRTKAGGDWTKGAQMYSQLKKRPSDDIFGDTARLDQFMKMKFDFNKFKGFFGKMKEELPVASESVLL